MDRILIGFLTAVSLFTAGVSAANPTQDTPRAEHAPPPMTGQTVATQGAITVDQVKINYQAQTGVLELSKEDPEDPVTGMFYVAYFKRMRIRTKAGRLPLSTTAGRAPPRCGCIWGRWGLNGLSLLSQRKHSWRLTNSPITNTVCSTSAIWCLSMPRNGLQPLFQQCRQPAGESAAKAQSASNVYGVNGDAQAFSQFIVQFLTHYQRWNSPKYLLGESYGTTRSVVLAETLKIRISILTVLS